MHFLCIGDHRPRRTAELLEAACAARDVPFVAIDAGNYGFLDGPRAAPGDLLYRTAVSIPAMRVENFLKSPGVRTFETGPYAAHMGPIAHVHAGIPTPRTVFHAPRDRALVRRQVEQLGGLPVVVKVLGGEGGVGIMRADSWPAIYSLLDQLRATGRAPLLMEYVADAPSWRAIVLGGELLAAYRSVPGPDDFRSNAEGGVADYEATPPDGLHELAVRAMDALGLAFGGVDVLAAPDGRLLVTDANFPCYFPEATDEMGIDIAGPMVDYLQRS